MVVLYLVDSYGKCGYACSICMHFKNECSGCEMEMESHPGFHTCVIFSCAVEKNVDSCLSCGDYPCRLSRGINRSYCPIHFALESNLHSQLISVYSNDHSKYEYLEIECVNNTNWNGNSKFQVSHEISVFIHLQ